jgi:quercetin dioxygenase-like cupin family protein
MRTRAEGRKTTTKDAKDAKRSAGAHLGVLGGLLIGACGALALAGTASAQSAVHEVLGEPVAIAPGFDAHMIIVDVPPAGNGPLTTAGQAGHRHPASTYAYVSKGAVVSRLGDGSEKRFETGQGWSETPNQPHYMVNASRTEPAQLVVVQIAKAGTKTLTEPLTAPRAPDKAAKPVDHLIHEK